MWPEWGEQGGQREQWNQASTEHTRLRYALLRTRASQCRASGRVRGFRLTLQAATGWEARKQPESCGSIPGKRQGSRHELPAEGAVKMA